MALINCPECKKEISSFSEKCIHCGFPLQTQAPTQAQLIIKAEKYPSTDLKSFKISIVDINGEELAEVHTGTAISIPIYKDIEIYAKYKHSPLSEKCKSNTIKIKADRTTRLQISYQRGLLLTKLYIYQVDCIDSE